jgi:hypothetical protein
MQRFLQAIKFIICSICKEGMNNNDSLRKGLRNAMKNTQKKLFWQQFDYLFEQ